MSCKNCKCADKKKETSSSDKEMQRQVVEGNNYLAKNIITAYEGDFGKRKYTFAFGAYPYENSYVIIKMAVVIHNPVDKFSSLVGSGLAGYELKYAEGNHKTAIRRSVWKSLTSAQKAEFVDNYIRNACLQEHLNVSRRTAMGGR